MKKIAETFTAMRIPAAEILTKTRIGRLNGRGVMLVSSIGGLHVVAAEDNGEILGAGVRPALARHAARTRAPELQFDDLAKSEPVDAAVLAAHLPAALAATATLRAAWERRQR